MRRHALSIAALAVTAASVLLFRTLQPARTPEPPSPTLPHPSSAAPNQQVAADTAWPDSLRDPATYCERRLRDVKANPSHWQNPDAWSAELKAAPDDDLRAGVVALARSIDARFFLAVLPGALESAKLEHRLSAARAIAQLPEPLLPHGIGSGAAAQDPDTRAEVLNVASNASAELRPALLSVALLHSPFPETRIQAARLLMERPDPSCFEALLPALDDPHADVRSCVAATVLEKTGHHLTSAAAAIAWWEKNRKRFDSMLLEIPGAPPAP